jgi:ribosomal protein S12 methylthiotransferase
LDIGFISLGCAKNQVDTEIMIGLLKKAGHRIVSRVEKADAVVVNTCGFITSAQEEAVDTILEMAELKRGGLQFLLVAGCLTQRFGEQLREDLPEVDAFLGIASYLRIPEAIAELQGGRKVFWVEPPSAKFVETGPRVLTTPRGFAYLKIAEGCDNRCSYCTIPSIRGSLRSNSIAALVEESRRLIGQGAKELVVIAQDTAAYGADRNGRGDSSEDLSALLEALSPLPGLEWLRLMYLHPHSITDRLIQTIKNCPAVVPYFDVPVQHIADTILTRMNRKDRGRDIAATLAALRREIPEAVLRTTVMVGFPGESEEDFAALYQFVAETEFDWLGAFIFEPQEGTPAAALPEQVLPDVARERYERILALQQDIVRVKNKRRLQQREPVLITGKKQSGLYVGRAYFQAPEVDGVVLVKSTQELAPGELVPVNFTAIRHYDMIGELDVEYTK